MKALYLLMQGQIFVFIMRLKEASKHKVKAHPRTAKKYRNNKRLNYKRHMNAGMIKSKFC